MMNSFIGGLILFAVFVAILAGVIILQVYLSKRESRWPGLILPAINLGLSLIGLLGMAVFMVVGTVGVQEITAINVRSEPLYIIEHPFNENDETIQMHQERLTIEAMQAEREALVASVNHDEPSRGSVMLRMLFVFLMANIPTVILLAIYAYCRKTRNKKQRGLDLMSVQDL